MAIATMTSKGQVTIPKEVRDELGLEPGTRLWFVRTSQGYVLRAASSSLMRLSGLLEGEVPRLTAAEIEQRLAEGLAEKFAPARVEDAAG